MQNLRYINSLKVCILLFVLLIKDMLLVCPVATINYALIIL